MLPLLGKRFACVVVFAVGVGCLLPETNQADGSSCSDDDGCKSSRCVQGFCSGSRCDLKDSSSCDDGWKCTHNNPDAVSDFFGSNGSDTCKPTCGHCPGNSHCPTKEPTADSLCASGKADLELSVVPEGRAIAGLPVKLKVVAAPPAAAIVECTWRGGGGSEEKTNGPEITRTFEQKGVSKLNVFCKDAGGANGSAEANIEVGCAAGGASCAIGFCCEVKEERCVRSLSGEGNVCRVPTAPTVAISGPAQTPISTEVEYSVAVTGGDGDVSGVSWKFSDDTIGSNVSSKTMKHRFSKAGVMTVKASVTTTIGSTGEATYPVTVCQKEGGRCDDGEPCCAPATCQGGAIKTCGL